MPLHHDKNCIGTAVNQKLLLLLRFKPSRKDGYKRTGVKKDLSFFVLLTKKVEGKQ